jgi:hypothetical protein
MSEPKRRLFDAGEDGIKAMIEAASMPGIVERDVMDPAPGLPRAGEQCGHWIPNELGLPEDCPVLPLGFNGNEFWFLDTAGQLISILRNEFSQSTINALFMGRHNFLAWMHPQWSATKEVVGWKANKVRETLMEACWRKGAWAPTERTRGRGAWQMRDGRLIVHSGTRLWTSDGHLDLGEIEGHVYMTRPPLVEPWPVPLTDVAGPACVLWPLLKTWNWERPELDPLLFMGWLGAAILGGAIEWRPVIFVTGDAGQGKSTLQRLAKLVLGDMLVQATDATAASVYQRFKVDALPVAIDEMEAETDTRRADTMIKMARAAASGGEIARGGDKGTPTEFKARSCFMFSSINVPPLENADRSRMALLFLRRLKEGTKKPYLDQAQLGRCGQAMMRKLIDNWHRFPATWRTYAEMLADAGHSGRGQEVFGTLMACADLIIDQDAAELGIKVGNGTEQLNVWHEHFKISEMAEYADIKENWRSALDHMLTATVDAWRGDHKSGKTMQTVLELLDRYVRGDMDHKEADAQLQKIGLRLLKPSRAGDREDRLFVPTQHQQAQKLFAGSKWFGRADAGVWDGAFRQAAEDIKRAENTYVQSKKHRGHSFALSTVFDRPIETMPQAPAPKLSEQDHGTL